MIINPYVTLCYYGDYRMDSNGDDNKFTFLDFLEADLSDACMHLVY